MGEKEEEEKRTWRENRYAGGVLEDKKKKKRKGKQERSVWWVAEEKKKKRKRREEEKKKGRMLCFSHRLIQSSSGKQTLQTITESVHWVCSSPSRHVVVLLCQTDGLFLPSIHFSADGFWQKTQTRPELHLYTNYCLIASPLLLQSQTANTLSQNCCFPLDAVFRFMTSLGNFWATLRRRRPEQRTVRRTRDSPSLRGRHQTFVPVIPGWIRHGAGVSSERVTSGRYKGLKQRHNCLLWLLSDERRRVIHLEPVDTINRMLCVWF